MEMRFGSIFRTCTSYVQTAIRDVNCAPTAYSEFWIVRVEVRYRYTNWIIAKSPVYRLIFGNIVLDLIYGPWPVRRLGESLFQKIRNLSVSWSEWIPKNTIHIVWQRIWKSQGLKMLSRWCQCPSRKTTTHFNISFFTIQRLEESRLKATTNRRTSVGGTGYNKHKTHHAGKCCIK